MSQRGRPPKPTKLKVLQGTDRKDRINENEPMPMEIDKLPDPPWHLDYYAKKEWQRAGEVLINAGLLTHADLSLFADYCRVHAYVIRIDMKLREGEELDLEFRTETGYRQKTPTVGLLDDFINLKMKLANKLGLSASDRTGIEVNPKSEDGPSIEDILNGSTG